jgi:exopolyphosphatase / guanosine-5'-triphosphate,3'-diphosphate pyrophosphatase
MQKKTAPIPSNSSAIAVIDIGTTSLRMTIAQPDAAGRVRPLEFLQQAVSLGKDTFTKGNIERGTVEDCVRALKNFRRVLDEYGITQEERVRAVATTAVREAGNRDAFIDRISIATGIRLEVLDDRDVTRLTYISARSLLSRDSSLSRGRVAVCEMSGGNTEILLLDKGNILATHSFKIGALRLREMLEKFNAPLARQRTLMESEIRRTIDQILHSIPASSIGNMTALGGDLRFAAHRLIPGYNPLLPARLPLRKLEKFTGSIMALSVNDCVRTFKMSFSEAETLAPSLLFYCMLARAFSLSSVIASGISMQHGILTEMARSGPPGDDVARQIIRSAWEIARKYRCDENHARHVTVLAGTLFSCLSQEHGLGARHGLLLSVAAILHDIGIFVNPRSHHKHSMYLIQNSELFGLSRRDINLVALVARYHRRATPKPVHQEYAALDRSERLTTAKLAAILRVADSLDRSHSRRISGIECRKEKERFVISVPNVDDLTLEQVALQNKGDMFEEVYGMSVVVEKKTDASAY